MSSINTADIQQAPLNVVFAGTPEFAAKHLSALISSQHNIIAVYTQPDRPAGRGNKITHSAVKSVAIEHNLPIFQPQSLKNQEQQAILAQLNADVMVVVAYGLILSKAILQTPKYGCLNVHGSLLPKWRGAAPIQRAIWAGDKFTGVSIMQMDEGLDTGDVLLEKSMAITPTATSATLYEDLAEIGPQALIETLDNLKDLVPVKQNEEDVSYAKKLSKEEAQLNWQLPAKQLARNIRAFNPWPVSWFSYHNQMIKVWRAEIVEAIDEAVPGTIVSADKTGIEVATAEHNLKLTTLQIPGKRQQSVEDIINGKPDLFVTGHIITTHQN